MADDMDRVVPLGQLDDFRVAEGDPDVRGWQVLGSDGRRIGEVDELLVDTAAMKVRYLDVDLDDGVAGDGGRDRHVLIPVGYARLERDGDRVMVDALASGDLGTLPAYDQGPLTRDYETSVRDSFVAHGADRPATPGVNTDLGATASTPGHLPDEDEMRARTASTGVGSDIGAAGMSAGDEGERIRRDADEDFYASPAFDDDRFYGRRG